MRIRRTSRNSDTFDRKFDAIISPILLDVGFSETQPYVFTRPDSTGRDFAYFGVEGKCFTVFLGYKPRYMEEIDQLYENAIMPNYGGCSFLTPKCMTHRFKEFPCRLAAQRDRSFSMVVEGLNTHALDWLASLRIPVCYADAVPPDTMMYLGRANEVAGRLDRAKEAYEEQMRRELGCWELWRNDDEAASQSSRTFVYLCLKLRRELDKCDRVMAALRFRPDVEPFPV
jgi:hypothetical protein